MATEQKDQGAKKDMAKGMDEAGRKPSQQTGTKAGQGAKGSDQISSGMAKSGSGQKPSQ
jgi:hypothetical protein